MGVGIEIPALLISRSIPPKYSATSSINASVAWPSARSSAQGWATLPPALISSTTPCTASALMSIAATRAPWSANNFAVAAPMPLPAPVTTATRPSIDRLRFDNAIAFLKNGYEARTTKGVLARAWWHSREQSWIAHALCRQQPPPYGSAS